MDRLYFETYEELAFDIDESFDSLDDKYGEVSIIAKYNEAKEIIRELIYIGYDIASVELHREEFEEYWDEYILGVNRDGIWCEKFKRDTGYITDESNVIYIMNNCSSAVIPYCKGEEAYEVSVDEDITGADNEEDAKLEYEYTINGEKVDKKIFDEYVSRLEKYDSIKTKKKYDESDDSYSISVKCNLDADEALEIIKDMENRMEHMNDMFREMDCFKGLFNW